MLLDFDGAQLGKADPVILRQRKAALGIAEGVEMILPFIARKAGGLAHVHAPKEGLIGLVYPTQSILQDLGVDLCVLLSQLFDCWELRRLLGVTDADLAHAVGIPALLKRGVVQLS